MGHQRKGTGQNKLDEVEPLYRRVLAISEQAHGGLDHLSVAVDCGNLAVLLKQQNKLDEAEPLYHRAWAISEKAQGVDLPDV